MTGLLVSTELSLYRVINCALQIQLLQAKVSLHLGGKDIVNIMLFFPNYRVSAYTYRKLK